MKAVFRTFGLYCLAFTGACATTAPKHYKMEPIRIQLTPDPLTGLTSFDAGDLLERGNALFDVEDYETAKLF